MLDTQNIFSPNTDFMYLNNIVRKIRDWSSSYGYNEIFLDEFIKISKVKKVLSGLFFPVKYFTIKFRNFCISPFLFINLKRSQWLVRRA